jgi:hypothetical protein
MPIELPSFLHRFNRDGTFDSICIRCFQTIVTNSEERLLAMAEMNHLCVPSAVTARTPKVKMNRNSDEPILPVAKYVFANRRS